MSKYTNAYDLASKADWEGGITGLIFGYGLSADELPDETPTDIRGCFAVVFGAEKALRRISEWLDEALQAGDPDGD